MDKKLRIALIPAYEPELILIKILIQLKKCSFETVVVNDGSESKFQEVFDKAAEYAEILVHKSNRGKGCAIKTGLEYIKEHYKGNYTVVILDADGQHTPEDAAKVCRASEQRPDALVLGSRALEENVPLRSRLGNSITRSVYSLSTGLNVHDTQTGLRAFKSKMIPTLLQIPGERYEYEMNVLLNFAREKTEIVEIPVSTIYMDANSASHFNTMKDSYRIYKEIIKFSGSSFLSFLVDYGLYSILSAITLTMGAYGIILSNVLARVASASLNYTINRNLVFRSESNALKSAEEYFLLAVIILAGNTLVLNGFVEGLGINRYLAKLMTEMIFFVFSWAVQHRIIFSRREI